MADQATRATFLAIQSERQYIPQVSHQEMPVPPRRPATTPVTARQVSMPEVELMPIQVPATAPMTTGTVILTLVRTPAFLSPSMVAGRDTPGAGSSGEAVVRRTWATQTTVRKAATASAATNQASYPRGLLTGAATAARAAASAMRVDERSGTTDTHGVRPRITIILVYMRW